MDDLLGHAGFRLHCNHCGHEYTLTLYGVLQEQRLRKEWHNLQGRSAVWDPDTLHVLDNIPQQALEQVEAAWQQVTAACEEAGLDLLIDSADAVHAHRH